MKLFKKPEPCDCPEARGYAAGPLTDNITWEVDRWGNKYWREFTYWLVNEKNFGRWFNDKRRAWRDFWNKRRYYKIARWVNILPFVPHGGGTLWNWSWQPRCCGFCGGVHPDDAVKLVQEGWSLEGTTKGYKFYMQPPALSKYENKRWSPVPPVKLYVYHLEGKHMLSINEALEHNYKAAKASA